MLQIVNLLYLVASLSFLLQLGNAHTDEKAVSADLKNDENKGQHYEAPFIKTIKSFHRSDTATIIREGGKMAAQNLGGKIKDFETKINEISGKREIEISKYHSIIESYQKPGLKVKIGVILKKLSWCPHDIVPAFVKFDVIDPIKAATKVFVRTVSKPIINYKKDLQNHYNAELEKQKADEKPSILKKWFSVPLALKTASTNVAAGRLKDLKALKTELLLSGKNSNATKQTSGEIEKTKSTN